MYFARQKVQYAVLETGLGGRKDPTNVCTPAVCLITSIGLDHTQYLGSSLAQIALEKAGIIKPKIPVFAGEMALAAREVLRKTAKERKAVTDAALAAKEAELKKLAALTMENIDKCIEFRARRGESCCL